jgi:O-succinylbenzoate synthase
MRNGELVEVVLKLAITCETHFVGDAQGGGGIDPELVSEFADVEENIVAGILKDRTKKFLTLGAEERESLGEIGAGRESAGFPGHVAYLPHPQAGVNLRSGHELCLSSGELAQRMLQTKDFESPDSAIGLTGARFFLRIREIGLQSQNASTVARSIRCGYEKQSIPAEPLFAEALPFADEDDHCGPGANGAESEPRVADGTGRGILRIEALTLREIHIRLKSSFETSFGKIWERRILLVEACSEGLSGWGEITAGEGPFYNSETTDTSWSIFCNFAAPIALGRDVKEPGEVSGLLRAIRGHEMTKAALENALWDIESQKQGVALARLLGGTAREIACGVSLGIQNSPEELLPIIEKELAAGYQRIKIKIKPGKDLEYIAAVRKRFPRVKLMVDANSAYGLEQASHLKKFDDYDLMMIEQPLAWDDIFEHAQLQTQLRTAICLDESIHNGHHARAAIEVDACRIINIKLGRVGGHSEARRVQEICRERSVPVWSGGMLETGIGRAHNIAMSSLPGFVLPGDVSASQRYWEEDVIDPEVEVTPAGTIVVPSKAGLGYAVRKKRIEQLTVRQQVFQSTSVQVPVAGAV